MFRSYNLNYRLTLGLTNTLVAECTFIHGNFLGSDVWNEDTMFPFPLSAVRNRNRMANISASVMAFNFGNLVTLDVRNINTLLPGHRSTFSALFLLNSVINGFRNFTTVLLGNLTTLLLGHISTFLLRDISTLLLVSNLLAGFLVDSLTFLLERGITFLLIRSIALTTIVGLKNNKEQ